MSAEEILNEIKSMASESNKNVLLKHGAKEPFYGVKIQDLKKIQKKIKKDHQLSLELYDSGVSDAMYLAGLISDPAKMTKKDLQKWAEKATWYMISEYAVAWTAAESPFGWEMALEWIDSPEEKMAAAGWSTLGSYASVRSDDELEMDSIRRLIDRVRDRIHDAPNRVRYAMNGFLISAAVHVAPLTDYAVETAKKIGPVEVEMGGTACKTPYAPEYVQKADSRGKIGKKRKTAKC